MKWSTRIFLVLFAALLVGGIVLIMRPKPVAVEVASATLGPLDQKVLGDGRARVRERYTISAPVAGTLARIELHEGDVVEPNAVVAHLLPLATPLQDPASRQAAQQRLAAAVDVEHQAQASVTRAEAAAAQAQREFTQTESLAKTGAVPNAQLDRATADANMRAAELASSKFAANIASHEIAQARAALQRYTPGARAAEQFEVSAPVHGQILHVFRQSEGVVAAGTPLLEIGDPTALELVVAVLSQDAVLIRPGMTAQALHWGGPHPLAAKVQRVEPAAFTRMSALGVDEQRVNVVLELDRAATTNDATAPAAQLGDGFAAEIEIVVWTKPNAITVPTSAVFRDGDAWAVYAVVDGRAQRRVVVPAHRSALLTEITAGIRANEVVIVHPSSNVRDGSRVTHR
jgi:HlyD family secretion protein